MYAGRQLLFPEANAEECSVVARSQADLTTLAGYGIAVAVVAVALLLRPFDQASWVVFVAAGLVMAWLTHRLGRAFPVHLSVGEMRIAGERKFTGMLHDLTKRARLESELGASEARWRAIVDSAVDGIIVIDACGRVEAFNPGAERLFGYSASEVCGQNVNMLMPSPYRDEHDGYLSRYLATGRAKIIGIGREVQGRRKDGSVFPLHLSVGEMRIGGERKFTGILHDLTDRVHMEAQLAEQAALAKLGEMAAVVAHEVKNPLAGIRGAVQVFASRLGDDGNTQILKEIIARIDALDQMMKDLLLFARPPQPKYSPTEVVPLVTSIASLMAQDPSASQVDVHIAGAAPPFPADAEMLRIVFQNLLINGVHAMQGKGTIHVAVEARDSTCQIAITDGGPGIPVRNSRKDLHAVLHDEVAWVRSRFADGQTSGGGPQGPAGHRLPANRRHHRRGPIANRVRGSDCARDGTRAHWWRRPVRAS